MEDELIDKVEELHRLLRQERQDNAELRQRMEEMRKQLQRSREEADTLREQMGTNQAGTSGTAGTSCKEKAAAKMTIKLHYQKEAASHRTVDTQTEQGQLEEDSQSLGKASTRTEPQRGWSPTHDVASQALATASSVTSGQGMVYMEEYKLYFDYNSGYYYDAERGLYYDGNRRVYLRYNETSREYDELPAEDVCQGSASTEREDGELEYEGDGKTEEELWEEERQRQRENGLIHKGQPPSMRIIVTKGDGDVKVGSLFLITCKGGSIGREGSEHALLLQDLGCSKFHGKIDFRDEKYFLTDLGSRNGTFINGKRMSVAKCESDPVEIGHGTRLQIGTTQMKCHVHPGRETCNDCEPGLLPTFSSAAPSLYATQPSATDRERHRKKEMKDLRKKYGLAAGTMENDKRLQADYCDRADKRRREIGSDNPAEKTEVASTSEAIKSSNKGFQMLSKMGWKSGDGLGSSVQGRVEPVDVEQRAERSGLGVAQINLGQDLGQAKKKRELWEKTQKRFENL